MEKIILVKTIHGYHDTSDHSYMVIFIFWQFEQFQLFGEIRTNWKMDYKDVFRISKIQLGPIVSGAVDEL